MDPLNYLITYYDVSDERALMLVKANPNLEGEQIAIKEGLESLPEFNPEERACEADDS